MGLAAHCSFGVADVRAAMFEFRAGPGDMTPVCCLLAGSSVGGLDRCEEDEDVDADEDEEDSSPKSVC